MNTTKVSTTNPTTKKIRYIPCNKGEFCSYLHCWKGCDFYHPKWHIICEDDGRCDDHRCPFKHERQNKKSFGKDTDCYENYAKKVVCRYDGDCWKRDCPFKHFKSVKAQCIVIEKKALKTIPIQKTPRPKKTSRPKKTVLKWNSVAMKRIAPIPVRIAPTTEDIEKRRDDHMDLYKKYVSLFYANATNTMVRCKHIAVRTSLRCGSRTKKKCGICSRCVVKSEHREKYATFRKKQRLNKYFK